MTDDEVIRAVRWRLGVPAYPSDDRLWFEFVRIAASQQQRSDIARALGNMFERAVLLKLQITCEVRPHERDLVDRFLEITRDGPPALHFTQKLNEIVYPNTAHYAPPPPPPPPQQIPVKQPVPNVVEGGATFPNPPKAQPRPQPSPPPVTPARQESIMKKTPKTDTAPATAAAPPSAAPPPPPPPAAEPEKAAVPPASPAPEAQSDADGMPPGAGLWKYLPVADPTDRHEDSAKGHLTLRSGGHVVGARVRGRKHKHDGTNCDDWFEFALCEPWLIIAVSDGAGSCSLSRVGARIATQTAVAYLKNALPDISLSKLIVDSARRNADHEFLRPDIQAVQVALHEAVWRAHKAVEREAQLREVETKSMSATLRLAVHTAVKEGFLNSRYHDFVLTCSVGDGMTAAIDEDNRLHLLGSEESGGKYSGETEFLTDSRAVAPERLFASTFAYVGHLRALMVMSDGVADPYFPNDPGMLRLFADLILNGVIKVKDKAAIPARPSVDPAAYSYVVDAPVGPDERLTARIRQSDRLAEQSKRTVEELLRSPLHPLVAAAAGEPMTRSIAGAVQEERLRIWLDTFYVRGEFDDRSLVVLHRESGL